MFDLIDECGKDLKRAGYKVETLCDGALSHATLNIKSQKESERFALDKGDYHIFTLPNLYDDEFCYGRILETKLCEVIKSLLKKENIKRDANVLIVGLGNADVECDRLGKEVFDRINIAPKSRKGKIYKFCPNIFFLTGINAIDLTKMLVDKFDINLVILIDSLTTNNLTRLGTSFQVTTSGLTPGSGVHRFGKKISREEIFSKIISIGVPFMINSSSFAGEKEDILLCQKDISSSVALAGEIIAGAINEVLK